MTQQELQKVMKFHLENFNDEHVVIDDNTIHNKVLSANDVYGSSNSKSIYNESIRWTLKKNGHTEKQWPADWFEKNVEYLASKII
ncbi:hypothetical protein ACFLTE_11285 [Bacteroidota bacterium]